MTKKTNPIDYLKLLDTICKCEHIAFILDEKYEYNNIFIKYILDDLKLKFKISIYDSFNIYSDRSRKSLCAEDNKNSELVDIKKIYIYKSNVTNFQLFGQAQKYELVLLFSENMIALKSRYGNKEKLGGNINLFLRKYKLNQLKKL